VTSVITTQALTRRFGDLTAVDALDLDIPAGGVVGFVGPNGSGKSTTIRMLLGLIRPTSGTATVLGHPITQPVRYAARVGALIESPALQGGLSARANLDSMARLRGIPKGRADEVLEVVSLSDRAGSKAKDFSLGMKQRLGIAIALLPDPEVLVLDEPTNGLDPAGIVEIRGLIRCLGDEGRTVLVSSHLLTEIEAAADRLVVIRYGELLFSGPLQALIAQEQRFVDLEAEDPGETERLAACLRARGLALSADGLRLRVAADPARSGELNRVAIEQGIVLRRVEPRSETLEDIFLRMTGEPGTSGTAAGAPALRLATGA
jgi:ABC-2 type transport system ATP-binding protein